VADRNASLKDVVDERGSGRDGFGFVSCVVRRAATESMFVRVVIAMSSQEACGS